MTHFVALYFLYALRPSAASGYWSSWTYTSHDIASLEQFELSTDAGEFVYAICVSADEFVESILLIFTNDEWSSQIGGSDDNTLCSAINTNQKDCWVALEGRSGDIIDTLTATTYRGWSPNPWGSSTGGSSSFSIAGHPEECITQLGVRTDGHFVVSIRAYFENIWATSTTQHPTTLPSATPTSLPTKIPSLYPTHDPTLDPSSLPTVSPSANPTVHPSAVPTYVELVLVTETASDANDDQNEGSVNEEGLVTTNSSEDNIINIKSRPDVDADSAAYWLLLPGVIVVCLCSIFAFCVRRTLRKTVGDEQGLGIQQDTRVELERVKSADKGMVQQTPGGEDDDATEGTEEDATKGTAESAAYGNDDMDLLPAASATTVGADEQQEMMRGEFIIECNENEWTQR